MYELKKQRIAKEYFTTDWGQSCGERVKKQF